MSAATGEWFTGSKAGLERIARRRGLAYVLFELVQNAWDSAAKEVKVSFVPVPGRPLVDVTVSDDDPDGFKDLAHAWTLFAESGKKDDPEKRGRFNLGEKLVLAICESAEIMSTKGTVYFDEDGRRTGRRCTDKGSVFTGRVKMTREEMEDVVAAADDLIAPKGVRTMIVTHRGAGDVTRRELGERALLRQIAVRLPTEVAGEDGFLKAVTRDTVLRIHAARERRDPETGIVRPYGWVHEMGIPVCPTGDPWDVDIQQKVPVNLERNSVSASYLRSVRVKVLNAMHADLTNEDAASPAIQDALTDKRISAEAVTQVLTLQYGDKRAVFDPSDPEANHRLVSEGYALIPGGAYTREAWANVRSSGAALPSGRIRPTPKPYSSDPNAKDRVLLTEAELTAGMKNIRKYSKVVAARILSDLEAVTIDVVFDRGQKDAGWLACYGSGELTFNVAALGRAFFDEGPSRRVNALLLHELAHEVEASHLSSGFHEALEDLGARLAELALREPDLFIQFGWNPRFQGGVPGQSPGGSGRSPV